MLNNEGKRYKMELNKKKIKIMRNDVARRRINQSINQSNLYNANILSVARLRGAKSKSVLKSKIDETVPQCQQVIGSAGVYGGKARSKRYALRHFLKVATEVDERTDSDELFQIITRNKTNNE